MQRSIPHADLRALPSVDDVLQREAARKWLEFLPRETVAGLVRAAIGRLRSSIIAGGGGETNPLHAVEGDIASNVNRLLRSTPRRVINASGVILHTNLGRAPLGARALRAISETAGKYCSLEYDIEHGKRGQRDAHCGELLETLLGRPAIAVNNNAAAIFLVLNELARDGHVIVSRGELVEIGDGFRIPDILGASQASLTEVGATNRTHLEDYRSAIGPGTKALLRIHTSNFRMVGFTGRPALGELAELARAASIPLVEDLGSGCMADLSPSGIVEEPLVTDSLEAGVNVVTFSGDKLLGGPQAGIIAGDADLVARFRRNPLFRALRVGKLTLAALNATLIDILTGNESGIPALRLARLSRDDLNVRAERFANRLTANAEFDADVVDGESVLGGGSTPMQGLPTALVALSPTAALSARDVERNLRASDPPVIVRIEKDRVLLDLRTVFETEEDDLFAALCSAAGKR